MLPGNLEVMELWQLSASQWRTTGFGLTGLDLPAVFAIAERVGIIADELLIRKLRMLEQETLSAQSLKSSEEKPDERRD